VEKQSVIYEYNATSTNDRAEILQELINRTKPEPYYSEWHDLIATQFRYPLPVGLKYQARFRPPHSMANVLYASELKTTAQYEHSYHFLKFRLGLKKTKRTGQRTLFSIKVLQGIYIDDLSNHPDLAALTDPNDYTASHRYVQENPSSQVIRYPSCRDPERRCNIAVRDISALDKQAHSEQILSFSYDRKKHAVTWLDTGLQIPWNLFVASPKSRKIKTVRSKRSRQNISSRSIHDNHQ
jgi:hypothetical protein